MGMFRPKGEEKMVKNTDDAVHDFMSVLEEFRKDVRAGQDKPLTIQEYLTKAAADPSYYATVAERLLTSIGEPKRIDTREDPRLSRIFSNRVIYEYPAFGDFYGSDMKESIMDVVRHLTSAAQNLEERKQVLYLLGPVGSAKSSIAERLKSLMEDQPIYVLQYQGKNGPEISPLNESPLPFIKHILDQKGQGSMLETKFGINKSYLKTCMSPWAYKRLEESGGDISKFTVIRREPSIGKQIAVSKTEPGDENNQDISALVGKVNTSMLDQFQQDDTDAYSYSGGLCKSNQGLMEFVEMFKAPIKVLHPLLTATQEGNYKGTEPIGNIPFDGLVLAHSNESEWKSFKGNKNNEAFLDRVHIVKVPYVREASEETKIYKKMLSESSLANAPCAPGTLEMLAEFIVMTRLAKPADGSSIYTKMKVYDGYDLTNVDPRAKTIKEYKDQAGLDEGMTGMSTRFAFKTLSETFNYNAAGTNDEPEADPIKLMMILESQIKKQQLPEEKEYMSFIKEYLVKDYFKKLGKDLQSAYLENSAGYGQNVFDKYITYADMWIQNEAYRDPDTGTTYDRAALNDKLEEIEKPAGIFNAKDFRNEVVNFVLRARVKNNGQNPDWRSYEKLKAVIEKKIFANFDEILPLISFGVKKDATEAAKHANFVEGMKKNGYSTETMIRRVGEWYTRMKPAMG